MRVVKHPWLRAMLLASVYVFGALGIMASVGGSGGGGGGGGVRVESIHLDQPTSPTYESRVTVSGYLGVIKPNINSEGEFVSLGDSYSDSVKVEWRNEFTGESGSETHRFKGECIFLPPLFINIHCSHSLDESGLSISVSLAVGSNRIKVEAEGKEAAVTVERLLAIPFVETTSAFNIGAFEATLDGKVNSRNVVTSAWFEYATDPGFASVISTPVISIPASYSLKIVSDRIDNLSGGTTYYYRLAASNFNGLVYGEIKSFTTQVPTLPNVTSLPATNITLDTATISGTVGTNSDDVIAWLEWDLDSALSSYTSTSPISIPFDSPATTIDENLTNLTDDTDYYFRIVATNSTGTTRGNILSLKTFTIPEVITSPAIELFPREATVSGSVNPKGINADAWFQLGFDPDFAAFDTSSSTVGTGSGQSFVPIDHLFDQLVPGSKYFYRLNASNAWGSAQGNILNFNTPLAGDTCWAKKYRSIVGTVSEHLSYNITSVEQTADDGFIAIGDRSLVISDSVLMKTNTEGGVEWSFDYDDEDFGKPSIRIVKEIESGRYIASGANGYNLWLVEHDQNGAIVWQQKYYSTASITYVDDIEVVSDGFLLVASYWPPNEDPDIVVLKFDRGGNLLWQYVFGGPEFEQASDIAVLDDGYLIVGLTESFGAGDADIWLIKLDPDGNIVWQSTLGDVNYDVGSAVAASTNGFTIVGRKSTGLWVIDLNSDGSINWQKEFFGISFPFGVHRTSDGGLVISGVKPSIYFTEKHLRLMKLDSMGTTEWTREFQGFSLPGTYGNINRIEELPPGGYIIGVNIYRSNLADAMALIKTNIDGSCQPITTGVTLTSSPISILPEQSTTVRVPGNLVSTESNIEKLDAYWAIEEAAP